MKQQGYDEKGFPIGGRRKETRAIPRAARMNLAHCVKKHLAEETRQWKPDG